jgi:hypothetical protein
MKRIFALLVLVLAGGLAAAATSGPTKTAIDPIALASAGVAGEIVVSGVNAGADPAIVVLRLDDTRSADYWTRVNLERRVPTGPFRFRVPVAGLKTPRGRPIDRSALTKAFVFAADGVRTLSIEAVDVELAPPLASKNGPVLAFDLGPDGAPVFPGFQALTPDDPRLSGQRFKTIVRPGTDALIGDGIEGVERLTLAPGPGRWRVVIWTDDPGEWEYLPHALERRIRINGKTVFERRMTADRWIREVYLAGRGGEWSPGAGPWEAFGARRGGRVETVSDAVGGEIRIDLAGSRRSTTFLSGVLIAPAEDPVPPAEIDHRRKLRLEETWRVGPTPPDATDVTAIAAAPGTPAVLTVTVRSETQVEDPAVEIEAPTLDGRNLPLWPLVGHWRLTRPDTAATMLVPDDRHLRGDGLHLPLRPDLPRRYTLVLPVPETARPGLYRGSITVAGARTVLSVEVLDLELPPAGAAVGLYLDDLPTHRWFRTPPESARICAMMALRMLGLTAVAPPLTTPDSVESIEDLVDDAMLARGLGFDAPLLAYTPLKRSKRRDLVARADRTLRVYGAPLLWSAADEISNHGGSFDALRQDLALLRHQAPGIRLAGHLNARRDSAIADAFDAVLVNSGYGLTVPRLHDLKADVPLVYLYNQGHPRLASGAYLWRTGLNGYLQWHAAMPTADPFDPTDGREADVAWLPPTPEDCPAVPDLDRGVLEMAEGITDLRWLRWLALQALRNATAAQMRDAIRDRLSGTWDRDKALTEKDLREIRTDIIALARQLRLGGEPSPVGRATDDRHTA